MSGLSNKHFLSLELLVCILVIFSTISLDFDEEHQEDINMQIDTINGELRLLTSSTMKSLGLEEFRPGAIVELNLSADTITATNCDICDNNPVGIRLSGEVVVSNLEPINSGGKVRIEGVLNVTHLQEYDGSNFITREWLTIDWDLDEFSKVINVFMEHQPAKWALKNRYDASLVAYDDIEKSRTGPVIYVEEILRKSVNVHGCLPNTMNCDGLNREEINLTTRLKNQLQPVNVSIPSKWVKLSDFDSHSNETVNLGDTKNLLETTNSIPNHHPWCLGDVENIDAMQSWNVSGENPSSIHPMGLWLTSLGMPSSSFTSSFGVWTEIDSGDIGCGAYSKNGNLILAISQI